MTQHAATPVGGPTRCRVRA